MKKIALLIIGLFVYNGVYAQENRVITTAVPFLMIPADARSAGMGDVGVATAADGYSQQHNPAKYAFALDQQGVSVSYTPYLTEIVNDINLGQLNYFYRLNERSAAAASLRYFGLGDIVLTESYDDPGRTVSPSELAFDLSYSLRLSERFSMAVAGRYIRSALKILMLPLMPRQRVLLLWMLRATTSQNKWPLVILMDAGELDSTSRIWDLKCSMTMMSLVLTFCLLTLK